ncbi:MAG: DUF3352 domain-containing protein, partial [Chloroflexi bacterium]|nr:DUF3352 domain-containing protein [Chloroflexota bacterium]
MVPRCLKIAAASAAIAVLGAIGYGGAVYFGVLPFPFFSDQPEHSARYYSDDVIAYSWLSLNPGNGQRKHLADMLDRVRDYSSVREAENEAEDALEETLDTDFEEVLAWIGSELSFAVIDPGWDGLPAMAGTVAVRDREAAEDFIDDLRDLMVDTSYSFVEFDEDDHGEFETWVAEDSYGDAIAIALSDDLLVVASDEPTLESILDRASGKQTRTLAGSERFQEARAALPDRRFLSLYVDAGSLQDAAGEWSGLPVDALGVAGMTGSPCVALAPTPDWIAVSVGAVERGVTMELVTPLTPGGWPEAPGLPDAAELLPDDTLGFAALSFNPSVEEWREALGSCAVADLLGEDLWDEVLAGVPADDQLA